MHLMEVLANGWIFIMFQMKQWLFLKACVTVKSPVHRIGKVGKHYSGSGSTSLLRQGHPREYCTGLHSDGFLISAVRDINQSHR